MTAGASILIVDDDRDLAESLADVLESRGYVVELAGSGEEGVERFRARPFDIVFTDIKLPGMSGVESFFEFRKIRPHAKVVMMTGFRVEQLVARAIENGALAVLHKPFAIPDILSVLDGVTPHGSVLVADDDADFAASIETILQAAGYRVVVAHDGADAVRLVAAGGVGCLVLDLVLPVLSGLDVYNELKLLDMLVPTIIVTGQPQAASAELSTLRSVAEGCLVKPFNPASLLAAVAANAR
jgi:two-component system response regulator HydG